MNVAARSPATQADIRVVPMTDRHAAEVLAVFQAGLDGGDASFETLAPDWAGWDAAHLAEHRLVACDPDGAVIGWAALSPVSDRCAYAGVAETSVYVRSAWAGRGMGGRLLAALVASSEAGGIWTLQAGIFPENAASLALHLSAGFRVVGVRERLGQRHGRWRDVMLLERRSKRIGSDDPLPGGSGR